MPKKTPLHVAKIKRRRQMGVLYGGADPAVQAVRHQYLSGIMQLKMVEACYIPAPGYELLKLTVELTDVDLHLARNDHEVVEILARLMFEKVAQMRRR